MGLTYAATLYAYTVLHALPHGSALHAHSYHPLCHPTTWVLQLLYTYLTITETGQGIVIIINLLWNLWFCLSHLWEYPRSTLPLIYGTETLVHLSPI